MTMLAPDATWTADSGGKVSAARRPVVGAERVARAIAGLVRRAGTELHVEMVTCNSAPAVLLYLRERLEGVITVEIVRRQDHELLRDAQPRQAGGPGDRSRHQPRLSDRRLGCENPPFCQARAVRIDRLGDLGAAPQVLRAVGDATARLDLPPPAALTGDWFGALAVIAPSLSAQPVDVDDAFAVQPGSQELAIHTRWAAAGSVTCPIPIPVPTSGPNRIPEAAGGWTDCVLRRDRDGQWWYESLSGAPMPDWLTAALAATPASARDCRIDWDTADRAAHRDGVLACLEAIRAGEVYQACVCTQFTGTVTGAPLDFFIDGVARTSPAGRPMLPGRGVRWRRCLRSFSCGGVERS